MMYRRRKVKVQVDGTVFVRNLTKYLHVATSYSLSCNEPCHVLMDIQTHEAGAQVIWKIPLEEVEKESDMELTLTAVTLLRA